MAPPRAPRPSPSWKPGPSQRETEAEGQKTTFRRDAVHILKGSWWPGPWLRKARAPARGRSPGGLAALLHQEVAAYVPPAHFRFPVLLCGSICRAPPASVASESWGLGRAAGGPWLAGTGESRALSRLCFLPYILPSPPPLPLPLCLGASPWQALLPAVPASPLAARSAPRHSLWLLLPFLSSSLAVWAHLMSTRPLHQLLTPPLPQGSQPSWWRPSSCLTQARTQGAVLSSSYLLNPSPRQ